MACVVHLRLRALWTEAPADMMPSFPALASTDTIMENPFKSRNPTKQGSVQWPTGPRNIRELALGNSTPRAWLCGLTFKVLTWQMEPQETFPLCGQKKTEADGMTSMGGGGRSRGEANYLH